MKEALPWSPGCQAQAAGLSTDRMQTQRAVGGIQLTAPGPLAYLADKDQAEVELEAPLPLVLM